MTKYSKRIDELEVGDVVTLPYTKEVRTISEVKGIRYKIVSEGIVEPRFYDHGEEVAYLGNKDKFMKEQKVDCSALYPYFDSLANDEVTLKHTNIPTHVKQNLKLIHELFEGVLDLTLEEVKTLYFERKMSNYSLDEKVNPTSYLTKKAKELCIGDKVVLSSPITVVEIISLQAVEDTHIRFTWQDSFRTYLKDVLVSVLKE